MDVIICPKCGHSNPASATNCQECRVNLAWALAELPKGERAREVQLQWLKDLNVLYRERPDMPLWEYTTVIILPEQVEVRKKPLLGLGKEKVTVGWEDVDRLFGELGELGWELVSVMPKPGSLMIKEGSPLSLALGGGKLVGGTTATDYFVAVFKRPLPRDIVEHALIEKTSELEKE